VLGAVVLDHLQKLDPLFSVGHVALDCLEGGPHRWRSVVVVEEGVDLREFRHLLITSIADILEFLLECVQFRSCSQA